MTHLRRLLKIKDAPSKVVRRIARLRARLDHTDPTIDGFQGNREQSDRMHAKRKRRDKIAAASRRANR